MFGVLIDKFRKRFVQKQYVGWGRLRPFPLCHPSIQRIRELLYVLGVQRFGALGFHARCPELLHQVACREPIVNTRVVKNFTASANRYSTLVNDAGSERYVTRYHQIVGRHLFHNPVIRDIGPV